ncbi:nucleotidyltransferase family protein [Cytobacillus oceanisediminis]|uniref:nucleotidyltransferase family protein n=1 Tax=Cytobacillus oceanisediminis TaxID=665099 RepID=UPI001C21BA08|nr:sugar phosphate nucleotidyltransferase [Cytobacillus oceanisediminis]MBU8772084.1 NTP transferase domain-containing protein [Cytobacillus oceanisediminis]
MRAVIVAGGKGMRLRPYTSVLPKPLLPLEDVPILEIILRQLAHFGFTHVTLTLYYKEKLIRNYFGDGSQYGLKVDYTIESKPTGSIGSLTLVEQLNEPFLLMNADILTDLNFKELYCSHINEGAIASLVLTDSTVNIDYGVIKTNNVGDIVDYNEKPTIINSISSGIYVLNPEVLQFLVKKKMDFYELINSMVSQEKKVKAFFHRGYWKDIGTFKEFQQASLDFLEKKEQFLYLKND